MTGSLIQPDALADLYAVARGTPPGAFVEVGVYRGGSARLLYELAEEQGRHLYLYDTWRGHPVVDPDRDDPVCHWVDRYSDAADCLADLRAAMPRATFCVGVFPDTLIPMAPVAFVHADCDLYWPTRAICELLPPRMVPGGVLLFDDYPFTGCPGVRQAVDEAFGRDGEVRPAGGRRVIRL